MAVSHSHFLPNLTLEIIRRFMKSVFFGDTGAVKTMISKRLVKQLGLIPIGMALSFNTREMVEVEKFRVNLLLPNKIELAELETICDELPDTDILIGMDVINLCDVAITHQSGKTKFSFQIPSSADLDFEIV